MIKYKYLRLNKYKKLRYLSINNQSKICIVFLHGFMSDLEGNKPKSLLKFCKTNKLGFVGLEYSGHGKSSGKFTKGNISTWSNDTKKIIKKFVKKRKVILIGSSMGSWIGLKQFKIFSNQKSFSRPSTLQHPLSTLPKSFQNPSKVHVPYYNPFKILQA